LSFEVLFHSVCLDCIDCLQVNEFEQCVISEAAVVHRALPQSLRADRYVLVVLHEAHDVLRVVARMVMRMMRVRVMLMVVLHARIARQRILRRMLIRVVLQRESGMLRVVMVGLLALRVTLVGVAALYGTEYVAPVPVVGG
jgi:hypothetical protein